MLRCLNPTGIIKAKSRIQLRWLFLPLECKLYSVKVNINLTPVPSEAYPATHSAGGVYADARSAAKTVQTIAFSGHGVLPPGHSVASDAAHSSVKADAVFSGMPEAPQLQLPMQLGRCSTYGVQFGAVPLNALSQQVLTLYNDSTEVSMAYSWNTNGLLEVDKSWVCMVLLF